MALTFSEEQLLQLKNDFYGGLKQTQRPRYVMAGAGDGRGYRQEGYSSSLNTDYYKNNSNWRAIGDELGININSMNDISALYDYFTQNYLGAGDGKKKEEEAKEPEALKPGDPGFTSEPTNNYANGMNADGTPKTQYDYSKYNEGALLEKAASQISTGFYDQSLGVNPEVAVQRFGHADLQGNLAAGQSATNLLEYFNSTGGSTLNPDQKKGKEGGIYEMVAAMAALEEPVKLTPLPGAGGPVGKMNIPAAQVGNNGNASGVRMKRSNASQSGTNAYGTSQFNRRNFGNPQRSSLSIGGLNI